MDDDDVNLRDYDAKLHVGSVEIASIEEDHVPPELLSVFTDEMYRSRASEFAAPGPVIADRLDILGFTPARVREALDGILDEHRRITDLARQYGSDESMAADDAEWSRLAGYTANDWIARLRAPARGSAPAGRLEPGSTGWLMSLIKDADRRIALRAAVLARPDDEVRLDITYLATMGALETTDGLRSSGLEAMRAAASAHAPIVVLTEGKSDIEFLEPALRLLYPHLADLIRFMDFGQRPGGGAGALVNTVKSFAAAGIANRVVALFDNDTAAADALRPLDRSRLPANVRVCQYPPLDLAADYPTLGPPPAHTQVANADINGLAGSIELYLGRDVLTGPAGKLRPVHWNTYIQGMQQYQGEITDKNAIHDAYRAKIRSAGTDRSGVAQQDWSGVRAILDLVLHAFD
jgi:hypothetical protein